MQIIRGSIHNYQKHYNIVFNDELLCLIVDKSDKYMKGSKLPDKAFAIIDDVGSACVLARCAPTEEIVDDVISVMARIPKAMLSNEDRTVLRDLPANLKKRVYGQDEACDIICKSIAKSRLGIREPNKPVSSMILAGRTGTGKTLTVQELGDILGLPLVKFDMSEYQQKETVSKLIGSSKGYSGYDEGGLLTTAIKKNPHCILLLDEIEKAHKDVYNTFLQVMDTAELTDNKGIKVDFRNVLLVMTSNLGVSELNKGSLGFCDSCVKDNQAVVIKAIKAEFSPEFFNRFDNVIVFNDLSPSNIQDITIHELKKIEARVAKIGVIIDFSPHAIEWLSTHGTNKEYGARILKRLLESSILDPLTDILLSEETGDILVDVAENKIILVSTEAAQAAG
jgi:ATP-dependent Clp protease ATP-binding subunit ClpA